MERILKQGGFLKRYKLIETQKKKKKNENQVVKFDSGSEDSGIDIMDDNMPLHSPQERNSDSEDSRISVNYTYNPIIINAD